MTKIWEEEINDFLIGNLIEKSNLDTKSNKSQKKLSSYLKKVKIIDVWRSLVGEYIYSKCTASCDDYGNLKITTDISAVKNEILLRKQSLISQINEQFGEDFIKQIEIR